MLHYRLPNIKLLLGIALCGAAAGGVWSARGALAADSFGKDTAQRVIARFGGLNLKPGAVKVKEISGVGGSRVVTAQIETAFLCEQDQQGEWRLAEIRTDDRRWEDVRLLEQALAREKTARATSELELLATALDSYRRERGGYVRTDEPGVLLDHLAPQFLPRVVRFDPWNKPYQYTSDGTRFELRSTGADGKAQTGDDLIVSR